jgi:hypothetical protein
MSQRTASVPRPDNPEQPSAWAQGLILFAAVMMMMAGGFQVIAGLAAIFENEFYTVTSDYVLEFDVSAWGWIHLLLGIAVGLAGFAVLSGQTWGRVVGIVLAVLSGLVNFAFVPYYPFWSLAIIALDVFIIWALATRGRDITR